MNPFQNIFPTAIIPKGLMNYTDHLGNIRVTYTKDPQTGTLEIMEENHYYPFGLKHEVYSSLTPKGFIADEEIEGGTLLVHLREDEFKYKYNGKEWQDELGLNFYDYGARNYDPALGRWMNMDPLGEKYKAYSPYSYVLNNPLVFIDPDGRDIIVVIGRYFNGAMQPRGSVGKISKKFHEAMKIFAKTDYGKAFLLSFMKEGDRIFGVTASENGKYHNQKLTIVDGYFDKATQDEKATYFITGDGAVEGIVRYMESEEHSGYNLVVIFDTEKLPIEKLLENIAHEFGLHLSSFDSVNADKKKGKKKSRKSESEDHQALKDKDTEADSYNTYKKLYEDMLMILRKQLSSNGKKPTN